MLIRINEKYVFIDVKYILTQKCLPWLDLADKSIPCRNWKLHLERQLLQLVLPTLREFLKGGCRLSACFRTNRIYYKALKEVRKSLSNMELNQEGFREELHEMFRKRLLLAVQNSFMTVDECIRRFMNLPDVHWLCSFEILEEFLTRYSIREPLRSQLIYAYCRIGREPDSVIDVLSQVSNDVLENLLCRAKKDKFDFWGLWRGFGDLGVKYNVVLEFLINNRSTKVLLKYGFPYAMPRSSYVIKHFELTYYRINGHSSLDFDTYYGLIQKSNWKRMILILETLRSFRLGGSSDDNSNLFRCVPDPYVTPSEMFSMLEHLKLIDDLSATCDRYAAAGIYDEDYTVYKPRRLVHLCRCVVREILAHNFKLPEGIDELEIPHSLKPYLALDC